GHQRAVGLRDRAAVTAPPSRPVAANTKNNRQAPGGPIPCPLVLPEWSVPRSGSTNRRILACPDGARTTSPGGADRGERASSLLVPLPPHPATPAQGAMKIVAAPLPSGVSTRAK